MRRARSSARKAQSTFVPPPILGINAQDNVADMDVRFALRMNNMFPEKSYVRGRRGKSEHGTVASGNIKTLHEYRYGSTTELVAFTDTGKWYDASSTGAATEIGTGHNGGLWDCVTHNDILVAAAKNTSDAPQQWNGTSQTAITLSGTGLTTTDLKKVAVHQSRLYWVEDGTLSFWYGATNSIGGMLTEFPLKHIAKSGGEILDIASWTVDGGDGLNDYLVIVTTGGDVIVYQGSDPGDATNFSIVGTWRIPEPIYDDGWGFMMEYGSDVLILTSEGVCSLHGLMQEGRFQGAADFTRNIRRYWIEDVRAYGRQSPWVMKVWPGRNMLFVHVPHGVVASGDHQWVMNTQTGAWGRYDYELEAIEHADVVLTGAWFYAAQGDTIFYLERGDSDDGANITAEMLQAFNDFGTPDKKKFHAVNGQWSADGSLSYKIDMAVDFQERSISSAGSRTLNPTTEGVEWAGRLIFDGTTPDVMEKRDTVTGEGRRGAIHFYSSQKTVEYAYLGGDVFFERGNV